MEREAMNEYGIIDPNLIAIIQHMEYADQYSRLMMMKCEKMAARVMRAIERKSYNA